MDFDKGACLHLTERPLQVCFLRSKYEVVSVDHAAQIFAAVLTAARGGSALSQIPCSPAASREKLPTSRVRLECRGDFASVVHTHEGTRASGESATYKFRSANACRCAVRGAYYQNFTTSSA